MAYDFTKNIDELSPVSFVDYINNVNPYDDLGDLLGDELFPDKPVLGIYSRRR